MVRPESSSDDPSNLVAEPQRSFVADADAKGLVQKDESRRLSCRGSTAASMPTPAMTGVAHSMGPRSSRVGMQRTPSEHDDRPLEALVPVRLIRSKPMNIA